MDDFRTDWVRFRLYNDFGYLFYTSTIDRPNLFFIPFLLHVILPWIVPTISFFYLIHQPFYVILECI